MKVTYEFDLDDEKRSDQHELTMIQKTKDFYNGLYEIHDFVRAIYKGYQKYSEEEVIDKILAIIAESGFHEVE